MARIVESDSPAAETTVHSFVMPYRDAIRCSFGIQCLESSCVNSCRDDRKPFGVPRPNISSKHQGLRLQRRRCRRPDQLCGGRRFQVVERFPPCVVHQSHCPAQTFQKHSLNEYLIPWSPFHSQAVTRYEMICLMKQKPAFQNQRLTTSP